MDSYWTGRIKSEKGGPEEPIIRQALLIQEVVNQFIFFIRKQTLKKKIPNLFIDCRYLINIDCADIESGFGIFGIGVLEVELREHVTMVFKKE